MKLAVLKGVKKCDLHGSVSFGKGKKLDSVTCIRASHKDMEQAASEKK